MSSSTSGSGSADVVYMVRQGDDNEELRYSLRSLANVEGLGNIWVVGYRPSWLTGVQAIQTHQHGTKWQATTRNVLTAIDCGDISDPFLLFNDDFFALRPVRYQTYHRGPLAVALSKNTLGLPYRKFGYEALERLQREGFENPLSFELHLPLIIHKATMRTVVYGQDKPLWKRSIYGNYAMRDGLISPTRRDDVKINADPAPKMAVLDWVSTSDRAFQTWEVGRLIRERFPEPSPYEQALADLRA